VHSVPEYVYDQAFAAERERLAGIERLWDPGTRAIMERLGITSGWQCLEVGAGGGSMAEWMADSVGPEGRVLATDVYTRFLDSIELPNLEVRMHDVLGGEPLAPEFDLVYARLVVEHLGTAALRRMVEAVRPAGLLLLEDYEWDSVAFEPPREEYDRITEAVIGMMAEAGFDPNFGRRLPAALEAAGLQDVDAEGRVRLIRGGTPETAFFRLSISSLRDTLVERGVLSDEEIGRMLSEFDDPATTAVSPILVSGWGRRGG
jgi:Methyltransferase domain